MQPCNGVLRCIMTMCKHEISLCEIVRVCGLGIGAAEGETRVQIFFGGRCRSVRASDSKVRCTGWGHVYLQLCIFGVSSVYLRFFGVSIMY
jgi:hypothetical protein